MKSFVAEVGAIPPASLRGNSRAHWGAKARDAKTWRTSGRWPGYVEGIAMRHVPRVSVHYAFHHWRKIDLDNLVIGMKSWLDGMVESEVIESDDPDHLVLEAPVFVKCQRGESHTVVTVTEVA